MILYWNFSDNVEQEVPKYAPTFDDLSPKQKQELIIKKFKKENFVPSTYYAKYDRKEENHKTENFSLKKRLRSAISKNRKMDDTNNL